MCVACAYLVQEVPPSGCSNLTRNRPRTTAATALPVAGGFRSWGAGSGCPALSGSAPPVTRLGPPSWLTSSLVSKDTDVPVFLKPGIFPKNDEFSALCMCQFLTHCSVILIY